LRDDLDAPAGAPRERIGTVAHAAPTRARAGEALPLLFVVDHPEQIASAYLHYRTAGARTYRRQLLVREHELDLRGEVPADVARAPGIEYFVEASTPSGHTGLALASPAHPIFVEVARPPLTDRLAPVVGQSTVKLAADYLDFATFDHRTGDHRDHTVESTVDFTYRLRGLVESLGVGYGVYSGTGGFADAVWTAASPAPTSAFQYGYADLELGGRTDQVHLAGGAQLIAGVGPQGFGLGIEGRVRLGDRDATNLMLLARTIDQVGTLSEVRFATRPIAAAIIGLSVGATNQPDHGDVGVKLGTDVEILELGDVSLTLKASWQGRSTEHGGLGGGASLGVSW
jgi:hypothetical protein